MHENVIEIIDFSEKYLIPVCELANRAFGEGYFSESRYRELKTKEYIFSIALYDKKFAGFCFSIYEDAKEAAEALKLDVCQVSSHADQKGYVCHAKSIVVVPEFHGTNTSNRLLAETVMKSQEAGMRSIWVAAWKFDGRIPAKRLLESSGFSALSEKELLWFDDKDYRCVVCDGVCRCSGVIYYKKI